MPPRSRSFHRGTHSRFRKCHLLPAPAAVTGCREMAGGCGERVHECKGHSLTCCCCLFPSPGPDNPRSPLHPAKEQWRHLGSDGRCRRCHQCPRCLLHDPPSRCRGNSTGGPVSAVPQHQTLPTPPLQPGSPTLGRSVGSAPILLGSTQDEAPLLQGKTLLCPLMNMDEGAENPPAGFLPTFMTQMNAGRAALTLSPCCPFRRIADSYVAVKEKTSNCRNILQQRYEGLKADSIGGMALPGQPFHCSYTALSSGVALCFVSSKNNHAILHHSCPLTQEVMVEHRAQTPLGIIKSWNGPGWLRFLRSPSPTISMTYKVPSPNHIP